MAENHAGGGLSTGASRVHEAGTTNAQQRLLGFAMYLSEGP